MVFPLDLHDLRQVNVQLHRGFPHRNALGKDVTTKRTDRESENTINNEPSREKCDTSVKKFHTTPFFENTQAIQTPKEIDVAEEGISVQKLIIRKRKVHADDDENRAENDKIVIEQRRNEQHDHKKDKSRENSRQKRQDHALTDGDLIRRELHRIDHLKRRIPANKPYFRIQNTKCCQCE